MAKVKKNKLSQRLKSRKLIVGLVCLAAGVSIDLLTERGLSENLLTLLIAILGIYVTGNVGAKATQAIQKNKDSQSQPVESGALNKEVQLIKNQQEEYNTYLNEIVNTISQLQQQVNNANNNVNKLLGKSANE